MGGGPSGIHVARNIVNSAGSTVSITVVDRQNYMDWCVASPRMLVQPEDIEKFGYVMPTDKVCEHIAGKKGKISFVQGAVSKIGATSVTLSDGRTLSADTIVVAVGGQYAGGPWKPLPDQTTRESRIAYMKTLKAKIASMKSVVVAGAGPTGVEVAGELKAAFPGHVITLVGTLLPNSPKVLQDRMKAALEKMGVVIIEGRVDVEGPDVNGNVKTRAGDVIENADIVLNAAGFTFQGKELADDKIQTDVTERGQFACRPTLQLASTDTVFCCGDILAVPQGCFADVKGVQHANDTAETVAKNVVFQLQKKPLVDFKWSKVPINKPMMTALGPSVAVGYMGMPNFMENFLGRKLKSKDYYMSLKGSSYGRGKTW